MSRKLNLGCGPHPIEGWENLDLLEHPGVRKHDLRKSLPFMNQTVDLIFSEHAIEHLTKPEALALFKECVRVLVPGGVMRISMPDLNVLCRNYVDMKLFQIPGVWEPKSLCDMVNEGMREWSHQYLWDLQELTCSLTNCGFSTVLPKDYHTSATRELCRREVRPFMNDLIVEAHKTL